MIKLEAIMEQVSLEAFVRKVMSDKGLSGFDVQRASNNAIHQTTVSRIRNGDVKNPSVPTLKALAKGMGVPEHELMAVARGLSIEKGNLAHERLAAIEFAYEGMPKKKKQKADYVIEMLEREIERINSEGDT